MVNTFEVITTDDKYRRNAMFHSLRTNGNRLERKVVRFSGYRLAKVDAVSGEIATDEKGRAKYVSTFSVAYPTR